MKKQIYLMMVAACLGLLTKAQTVIPAYVPTNGLVGWWPFNGNANDESGNGNNGTVNGATLTSDRFGNTNKTYNFDGLNDRIKIPFNSALGNDTGTVSLWINSSQIPNSNDQDILFGKGWGYPQLIYSNDAKAYISIANSTSSFSVIGTQQNLSTNQWRHILATYEGSSLKIYIDGTLSNSTNLSPSPTYFSYCNSEYWIGGFRHLNSCMPNDSVQFFNGKIDDIGIWNRALTPCEVKKLYTSGSFSVSSSSSNTICVGQSLNLTAAGATTYTWSTGATSQSISVSPTVSTVYTVSTTYSAGCTDSRTFSVTVNACTGLNEAELVTNSVRIFPNPAKEQLNIMVNNNAVMGKKYSITNTLGQEVASGIFTKLTTELNIQHLSAGLYQLNIEGLNENYKFIKE